MIIKISSRIEEYRYKALAKDINELSGRTNQPELTKFICQNIINKLNLQTKNTLVDIGCGDGTLLKLIRESIKNRVGILPTAEEVKRVSDIFSNKSNISIKQGTATNTNLTNSFADIVICNGVFLFLTEKEIDTALHEIVRISASQAKVFIGEIPYKNEFAKRNYGDSILRWLLWVLKHQGWKDFKIRFQQVTKGIFSNEPFVIMPKNIYWIKPQEFIKKAEKCGLKLIESYKHQTLDKYNNPVTCKNRQNYIFELSAKLKVEDDDENENDD